MFWNSGGINSVILKLLCKHNMPRMAVVAILDVAIFFAIQPAVRITTSTGTKKKAGIQVKDVSIWNISRIRHGCHQRAERGAAVLKTHVCIARSVDHGQYDIVPFILVLISRYIQTLATNLAAALSIPW